MSVKTFNISFPAELVELIDKNARRSYASRSEYIKIAVMLRLGVSDLSKIETPKEQAVQNTQPSSSWLEESDPELASFFKEQGVPLP